MKELIVIVGTAILGCIIFGMIVGDKDSLRVHAGQAIEENIATYREIARCDL